MRIGPRHGGQGEGYAVARDGSPIYYRAFGADDPDRATLPLVLSDGIGCDGYVWKYLERELAGERRILHWHYRGHGRTPEPRDRSRVSMADLADDLASVMDDAAVARGVPLASMTDARSSARSGMPRRRRSRGTGVRPWPR